MTRDFTIDGHGSVFILIPHTPEAKDWVAEKISEDRTEFGKGIVIEHRYVLDIATAIREEGFKVNT